MSLIEELSVLADEIKADLLPEFGVRPFQVTVRQVRRLAGTGESVTLRETVLSPPPMVRQATTGPQMALDPSGWDHFGVMVVDEISFQYTLARLTGTDLLDRVDKHDDLLNIWELKIVVPAGNTLQPRFYMPKSEPYPSPNKLGWTVVLEPFALNPFRSRDRSSRFARPST